MRLYVVLAAALIAAPMVQAADNFTIDTNHTYAHFAISHLGFSTMRGRINSTGGRFSIDGNTGTVNVSLDPASIDTGHEKRDDHLRSPDFLNVVEFPDMKYESTQVELSDNGGTVEGNLTLLGQTRPVVLTITARNCGPNPMSKKQTCGFDASAKIKRSDFGIQYGIPAIGDEMELWFELEGIMDE